MNCSIYFCAINSKAKDVDADYREMFIHLKNERRLLFYTTSLTVYHKNTIVYYIYKQEKQKYVFFLCFNGVIDTDINNIFTFFEDLQKVFNIHAGKGILPEEKFFAIQQELLNDFAIHKITNHKFTECYAPTYTSIENSSSEKSFDDITKDKLVSQDIVEAIKQYQWIYINLKCLKEFGKIFDFYEHHSKFNAIAVTISVLCTIALLLTIFALVFDAGAWAWFWLIYLFIGIGVLFYFKQLTICTVLSMCFYKKFVDYAYSQNFYNKSLLTYKNPHDIKETEYNLGMCYHDGEGVTKDREQAVYWYTKAAEQGDAKAQNNLGVCYGNGERVTKDYKQAVYWYTKAAELGNVEAQYNLGRCYRYGTGVTKDYKQAVYWYTKAAEQGNVKAQKSLGFCYRYGCFGVEIDLQKADYWYDKANKNK